MVMVTVMARPISMYKHTNPFIYSMFLTVRSIFVFQVWFLDYYHYLLLLVHQNKIKQQKLCIIEIFRAIQREREREKIA